MRYAGEPRVDMMHERRNVSITSTYGWTQEKTVDTTTIPEHTCAAKGTTINNSIYYFYDYCSYYVAIYVNS